MKSSKFWIAVVAAGVVMNIVDYLVQGMWLSNTIYSQMPETFNLSTNPLWYVFGDFVTVFIFAWVYDRVYGSFGGTIKGGAVYGLYAGILVNFPTWIFMHLFIRGYSYSLAWISTTYGIAWGVAAGAIVGAIYKKVSAPAA
jgi:hypothetical protein